MTHPVRLLVLVTDPSSEKCPAFVRMRPRPGHRWRLVPYDPEHERYVLELDEPARVELRAVGPAQWCVAERTLSLVRGDNHATMVVGPVEALCSTAVNRSHIYFQPSLEVELRGAELRNHLEARLPRGIRRRVRDPATACAAADHVSLSLEFEGSAEQRAADREQVANIVDDLVDNGHWVKLSMSLVHATGQVQRITNELIVGFKQGVTTGQRAVVLEDHQLEPTCRHLPHVGEDVYLARRRGAPHHDLLETVTRLDRHEHVAFAEPNYLYEIVRHDHEQDGSPSGRGHAHHFLSPEQPELEAIAAPAAWNLAHEAAGTIMVAVVDPDGVDPDHPNLPRPITSWDFATNQRQQRSNLNGEHGTQCASSAVGSAHAGRGTAGVARGCGLIAARIPSHSTTEQIVAAWMWAAGLASGPGELQPPLPSPGADVILNAWGPRSAEHSTVIQQALHRITAEGRNGKGCVICFSAGDRGYVPAGEANPLAAYREVIVVGACIKENPTNPCCSTQPDPSGRMHDLPAVKDARAYYSPYGDEVALVAPSSTAEWGQRIIDPIVSASVIGKGTLISHPVSTTQLAGHAKANSARIEVASTLGFEVQGVALLGSPHDPGREYTRITAIEGSTLVVDPLHRDHPARTTVSTGPLDYSRSFGGTSYAVSTVAGAAALVLSVDSELTWQEVREVLCETARNIEPQPSQPPQPRWWGAGCLDVEKAVREAMRRKQARALATGNVA